MFPTCFLRMTIIMVIITFVLVEFIGYLVVKFDSGYYSMESVKMKFKDFKSIYELNPERFDFNRTDRFWSRAYYDTGKYYVAFDNERYYYIYFSFVDWFRFKNFMRNYKRKKRNKKKINDNNEENKRIEFIINTALKDIENMNKRMSKEIRVNKNKKN